MQKKKKHYIKIGFKNIVIQIYKTFIATRQLLCFCQWSTKLFIMVSGILTYTDEWLSLDRFDSCSLWSKPMSRRPPIPRSSSTDHVFLETRLCRMEMGHVRMTVEGKNDCRKYRLYGTTVHPIPREHPPPRWAFIFPICLSRCSASQYFPYTPSSSLEPGTFRDVDLLVQMKQPVYIQALDEEPWGNGMVDLTMCCRHFH